MCHHKAYHRGKGHHHAANWKRNWEQHPMKKHWKQKMKARFQQPPVNVEEQDDQFMLYVFAPGFEKEDFQISTADNIMTVAVDKETVEDSTFWKRKEYEAKGFKRQFELNDKIDTTAISATYRNGVLIVTLPKLEGEETIRQDIQLV